MDKECVGKVWGGSGARWRGKRVICNTVINQSINSHLQHRTFPYMDRHPESQPQICYKIFFLLCSFFLSITLNMYFLKFGILIVPKGQPTLSLFHLCHTLNTERPINI